MTLDAITHYLDSEGNESTHECIAHAFDATMRAGVQKIVIFTGTGDGAQYAVSEFLSKEQYRHLRVVAVTPPVGRKYALRPGEENTPLVQAGIPPTVRDDLWAMGVEIVSAHLPFKEVHTGHEYDRASEWSRVAHAFGVLGGGFALCVQAILVACDAGAIQSGERVTVLSADTAFIATACRTESFLSPTEGLLVEHIVCRPMRYNISKRNHRLLDLTWGRTAPVEPAPGEQLALPESIEPDDYGDKEPPAAGE